MENQIENKKVQIKIGDLYLEDIYVDSDYPNTRFIREIGLKSEGCVEYDYKDALLIIEILSQIGLKSEICFLED